MNTKEIKDIIFKYAVINAVKHDGKASKGSVVGKVIAEKPELKKDIKDVMRLIDEELLIVNKMPFNELKELAETRFADSLVKKDEEKSIFAKLDVSKENVDLSKYNVADGTKYCIRTAFPPSPEKYLHIGHAKAALLNYLLAKEYGGEFYLRFEDTNPKLVKKEFYKAIEDDLRWLGINPDKIMFASDYMQLYYDFAEKLINSGDAYVCTCSVETIRENRANGKACACRNRSPEENMRLWKKMLDAKIKAILRLKIDVAHKNSAMRDPTIFRIIEEKHPRVDAKVWPNYDFQNSIMDGYFAVTHRLRSKEFELRNELQRYIQKLLNLYPTKIFELARFNLKGVETSGRKIRELIEKGDIVGWDDPSLSTLRAFKRRGFLPETIRDFVISTGISKNEATLTWNDLILINRRYLDKIAKRYFLIQNPVKINIKNAPLRKVKLNAYPKDAGKIEERIFDCNDTFFIEKKDYDEIVSIAERDSSSVFRLMDNLNFRYDGGFVFDSIDYSEYKGKGKKIIHWLPEKNIHISVLMPGKDKTTKIEAIAETNISSLQENAIVQFERFGFCRFDDKKSYLFVYTHN